MDDIIEPTMDYDFSKLYFGPPSTLVGGAYFTKLMYNSNKSLFIQTPKGLTKQGFVRSGKKMYADLMFDNNDTVFIHWVENLEAKCQELLYAKRETWFENKLDKDDIENAFTSPFKIFKSGKYYLLRVNVKQNIKIYDEQNTTISSDLITSDKTIISILEIQGLKFTSRNFQMEIVLKQAMVVSPDPFLDECFIRKPATRIKTAIAKEQSLDIKKNPVLQDNHEDHEDNHEDHEDNLEDQEDNPEDQEDILNDLINNSAQDLSNKRHEPIDLDDSFEEKVAPPVFNKNNNFGLEEVELHIEDLEPDKELKEPELKEVELTTTAIDNNLEVMKLTKPKQVYYDIYTKARKRAKEAKKQAIQAYNEMLHIKKKYILDDIHLRDTNFNNFDTDTLEEEE